MNFLQISVIVAATFGGFLFGYEISIMNIILIMDAFRIYFNFSIWDGVIVNGKSQDVSYDYTIVKTPFHRDLEEGYLRPSKEGTVASLLLFGAIFGALFSYKLEKKYGARLIIYVFSGIFIIGGLLQVYASDLFDVFLCGRFISGLCIGCICVICPSYVVEVAPVKLRNFVNTCYQVSVGLGVGITTLICGILWYIADTNPSDAVNKIGNRKLNDEINNIYWKCALSIQVFLAIIFGISIFILPTSPRWLCTQNRDAEAVYIIERINSVSFSNDLIQNEIKAIQNSATDSYLSGYLKNCRLFGKVNRRQSYITIIFQFFQQWTGINSFLYYQPRISIFFGFTRIMGIFIIPIINGIIYCISSILGMFFIHKFSRKLILVIGQILLILCNMGILINMNTSMMSAGINGIGYDHRSDEDDNNNNNLNIFKCNDNKLEELKYFVPELNVTIFSNYCHQSKINCLNGFPISSDADGGHFFENFKNETLMDVICDRMVDMRYDQGSKARIIIMICIFLFIFTYGCSWGCVPNIYQSEIFHHSMRAKGTALSITSHFLFGALNVYYTLFIINDLESHYLIVFSIICGFGFIFALMFCEESQGSMFDEIEKELISERKYDS